MREGGVIALAKQVHFSRINPFFKLKQKNEVVVAKIFFALSRLTFTFNGEFFLEEGPIPAIGNSFNKKCFSFFLAKVIFRSQQAKNGVVEA